MVKHLRQQLTYVISDYVSTAAAMLVFECLRFNIDHTSQLWFSSLRQFLSSAMVLEEILLFPLLMLGLYWLSGFYNNVILKSRLVNFLTTIYTSLLGTLVFFFSAVINDVDLSHIDFYWIMMWLFVCLLTCVYTSRHIVTRVMRHDLKRGRICRPTLIVGTGDDAIDMAHRLTRNYMAMGMRIDGFIDPSEPGSEISTVDNKPVYPISQVEKAIADYGTECLVVMNSGDKTMQIVNRLLPSGCTVFVSPDFYQTLNAPIRTANVAGEPLVDLSHPNQSASTANIKRLIDIITSAVAIVLLSPVMLVIALMIRRDSKGPIIYSQIRIGRNKRPFKILKFRTMYDGAETAGPRLATNDDPRITPLGRTLRKYRLDELPQFWNILKGDMSLVGPRPEREYYIKQIIERMPAYTVVQQVRPGLTSWGMVKFGYASDVDQMLKRLNYELIYLDNMTLLVDFRIILYTIKIVISGKGL
ncbi:MAG: sugar transferase [Muribaculum sp.]|nr:sugar transferase [Muribaculum sp.]